MKCLLTCLGFLTFSGASAQIALYTSKTTGEFSEYTGDYTKTTDKYEKGSLTYTLQGPIKATVNPTSIAINPNETKTWYGKIFPDRASAPAPGKSAPAALLYNAITQFSRPATGTTASGQTIVSTYTCPGCAAHPDGGQHEIVSKTTTGQLGFVVYSLGLTLTEPDCAYKGSNLKITATGYPAGGTYEWKSLSPGIKVTGNAAEGIITCERDGGIGTGKIEISYKIGAVTHKVTKEVTFFRLALTLVPDKPICDGEGIKVILKPRPAISPNRVKKSITNLEIKSKPLVDKGEKAINIVNITRIDFSAPDGNLESTAPVVYWFIPDKRKTECIFDSKYEIWAEGTNKADEGRITTEPASLTVGVQFNQCIKGEANILLTLPVLDKPVYRIRDNTDTGITFHQPPGNYPGFGIKISQTGRRTFMKASFTLGNLKLSNSVAKNSTSSASQFYPLVEFEENFHVAQFGGQTKIPELANILSAQRVIDQVNARLRAVPFTPANRNQVLGRYTLNCWLEFIRVLKEEVEDFNKLTKGWGKNIRCRLEQEAKDALKTKFGEIFTADMPCAYPGCPQK